MVEVLKSTATVLGGFREVAYEIDGAHISIDLDADLCDSNTMLQGKLLETGAVGRIYFSTPFPSRDVSSDLGTFTAAPLRDE